MLSTPEFTEWSKDYVLFLHITSRVEGEPYSNLLSQKGGRGFPYVVVMSPGGTVLEVVPGRNRTIPGFRETVAAAQVKLSAWHALRDKENRTAEEDVELLELDVRYDGLSIEETRERAEALDELDTALRERVDRFLVNREVQHHLDRAAEDESLAAEIGGIFLGMYREGRIPTGDRSFIAQFFASQLDHAEAERDAELFESILATLQEQIGQVNPRWLATQQQRLARLRQ